MNKKCLSLMLPFVGMISCAQNSHRLSYTEQLNEYRQKYKIDFLTDDRSPLSKADTGYLDFFPANDNYIVTAKIEITPDAEHFQMPTANGSSKPYRQFGIVTFTINDTTSTLIVYQSINLVKKDKYKDHLFLPFTDATTYIETYGGGRYLDLSQKDITNGELELDFNKAYNPWCAYATGYLCPIPPPENRLKIAISAGEKKYKGIKKH